MDGSVKCEGELMIYLRTVVGKTQASDAFAGELYDDNEFLLGTTWNSE